ncbi:hypothetical protein K0M31_005593, partial [Melipona bicolor]
NRSKEFQKVDDNQKGTIKEIQTSPDSVATRMKLNTAFWLFFPKERKRNQPEQAMDRFLPIEKPRIALSKLIVKASDSISWEAGSRAFSQLVQTFMRADKRTKALGLLRISTYFGIGYEIDRLG